MQIKTMYLLYLTTIALADLYSASRSIHVLDRHLRLGLCKNVLRATFALSIDLKNHKLFDRGTFYNYRLVPRNPFEGGNPKLCQKLLYLKYI